MRKRRQYRNIIKHISTLQLTQPDDLDEYSQKDLFTDLTSSRGTSLFLGQYSQKGITFALWKLSVLKQLAKKGFDNVSISIDTTRPYQHILRAHHILEGKKYLLVELVMRRGSFTLPDEIQSKMDRPSFDIVMVEWILLQNPLAKFSSKRPQLPAQSYPGLGIGSSVMEIFYWIGRRAKADGVLIVPNHLHSAIFYNREFFFVDSQKQAILNEIRKGLLKRNSLAQVTWACEEGKIIYKNDGTTLKWTPSEMILPVSKALNDYIYSSAYRSGMKDFQSNLSYGIEPGYKKKFDDNWKAI